MTRITGVRAGIFTVILLASRALAGGQKAPICHIPPDNPDNARTISVSVNALPDHLAHGDDACSCEEADSVAATCPDSFDPVTCECEVDCTIEVGTTAWAGSPDGSGGFECTCGGVTLDLDTDFFYACSAAGGAATSYDPIGICTCTPS